MIRERIENKLSTLNGLKNVRKEILIGTIKNVIRDVIRQYEKEYVIELEDIIADELRQVSISITEVGRELVITDNIKEDYKIHMISIYNQIEELLKLCKKMDISPWISGILVLTSELADTKICVEGEEDTAITFRELIRYASIDQV